MIIKGLTFVGTSTNSRPEMAVFVRDVLGLAPVSVDGVEADLFDMPDRTSFAVASADGMGTDRTIGFLVDDVERALAELRAAGIETDPAISENDRHRYVHFRAPDGQLYELVENRVSTDDLLTSLLAEEDRLVFPHFDHQTAWDLGTAMRQQALADNLPVAISIRRNGQRLFHTALPGSAADNDAWLERKSAVVDRYAHSSYFVGSQFRARGGDFDVDARLDVNAYAAHGGAFPLLVRSAGCVGTIAVSGLPQVDDHRFVVAQIERFLARPA